MPEFSIASSSQDFPAIASSMLPYRCSILRHIYGVTYLCRSYQGVLQDHVQQMVNASMFAAAARRSHQVEPAVEAKVVSYLQSDDKGKGSSLGLRCPCVVWCVADYTQTETPALATALA